MSRPEDIDDTRGAESGSEGAVGKAAGSSHDGKKPAEGVPGSRAAVVAISAVFAVVGLVAVCATATIGPIGVGLQEKARLPEPGLSGLGQTAVHEHVWMPAYAMEHRAAVTDTRDVDPTYATETALHTVCNDCLSIVDGKGQQHLDETGHSGYTPDVPVTDEVMTSAGGTETVVLEEEADELVVTGEKCALCGEERDAPEGSEASL